MRSSFETTGIHTKAIRRQHTHEQYIKGSTKAGKAQEGTVLQSGSASSGRQPVQAAGATNTAVRTPRGCALSEVHRLLQSLASGIQAPCVHSDQRRTRMRTDTHAPSKLGKNGVGDSSSRLAAA